MAKPPTRRPLIAAFGAAALLHMALLPVLGVVVRPTPSRPPTPGWSMHWAQPLADVPVGGELRAELVIVREPHPGQGVPNDTTPPTVTPDKIGDPSPRDAEARVWVELVLSRDRRAGPGDHVLGRREVALPDAGGRGSTMVTASLPAAVGEPAGAGPWHLLARPIGGGGEVAGSDPATAAAERLTADDRDADPARRRRRAVAPVWLGPRNAGRVVVEAVAAPRSAVAGGRLSIRGSLRNLGPGWLAAVGPTGPGGETRGAVEAWVSVDDRVSHDDLRLGRLPRGADLPPGAAWAWGNMISAQSGDQATERSQPESGNPAAPQSGLEGWLPLTLTPGPYRLIVRVVEPAASSSPPEGDGGAWSASASEAAEILPLRIDAATHPDLVVGELTFPRRVVVDRPATLRFSILNASPVPVTPTPPTGDPHGEGHPGAGDAGWSTGIYLSRDAVWSADDVWLGQVPGGDLGPRGRWASPPVGLAIRPEQAVASSMYLLAVADTAAPGVDRPVGDDGETAGGRGAVDEGDYEGNNVWAQPLELVRPEEVDEALELELGRADEPPRVTVAWIAHDDFEALLARPSRTLQPAVQDRAEPTPDAPLNPDPRGEAAAAASAASDPASAAGGSAGDGSPPASMSASAEAGESPPPLDPATGPSPRPPTGTAGNPSDRSRIQPTPGTSPGTSPGTNPGTQPGTSSAAAAEVANREAAEADAPADAVAGPDEPGPPRPTSTPRSDREADPTRLVDRDGVRPGEVLVGPGLEVRTYRPRWNAVAAFRVPLNPEVVVTFDPDGTVLDARLLRSTGFVDLDAPLLASLYRWRATGDRLKGMDAPFQLRLTVLLNDRELSPGGRADEGGQEETEGAAAD